MVKAIRFGLKPCVDGTVRRWREVWPRSEAVSCVWAPTRPAAVVHAGRQSIRRPPKRWAHLAEAHAQQAPTFRSRVASTRLTATAALQALRQHGGERAELPSPSTLAKVLKRLGLR